MRVGDVLEWLACAAFTAGTALATHRLWPAVLVAGACLAYQAQCHGSTTLPKASRPGWLRVPGALKRKAQT